MSSPLTQLAPPVEALQISRPAPVLSLPNEILIQIFNVFGQHHWSTLLKLAQVCQHFRQIAKYAIAHNDIPSGWWIHDQRVLSHLPPQNCICGSCHGDLPRYTISDRMKRSKQFVFGGLRLVCKTSHVCCFYGLWRRDSLPIDSLVMGEKTWAVCLDCRYPILEPDSSCADHARWLERLQEMYEEM